LNNLKKYIPVFILLIALYGLSYKLPIAIIVPWILISYCFTAKHMRLKKLSIYFLILSLFLFIYAYFSILPAVFDKSFEGGIRNGMYLVFCLMPLFFQAYFLDLDKDELEKGLRASFIIISIMILTFFFTGIISSDRYQQVGNIVALTSLLMLYSGKKKLAYLSVVGFVLILFIGSRQALIGAVFAISIIYLVNKSLRFNLTLATAVLSIFLLNIADVHKTTFDDYDILNFINDSEIQTLSRIIYKLNNEEERILIWKLFLSETEVLPKGVFFGNTKKIMEQPHNFFIEYTYVNGYLFGLPFLLLIIFAIRKIITKNKILGIMLLFYFIPFNVSFGLTAAKYFLFFMFLSLGLDAKTRKNITF